VTLCIGRDGPAPELATLHGQLPLESDLFNTRSTHCLTQNQLIKMVVLKVLGLCVALAAVVQSTQCPSGPPRVDTYSGGFNYTYNWPIHYQQLQTQHQSLCQAYMDVSPQHPCGKTIVMLHGKNFCSQTWNATAKVLLSQGYRVIMPDQIGFCKSDKPEYYQYSLQQLALNTKTILDNLNITKVTIMGHSMGGMLSARFALTYPSMIERLVMVDPIGLEDWKAKGVPYLPIDSLYNVEAASNYTSIASYENATYYVNQWKPEYDVWVNMLLKIYQGPLGKTYAFDQALVTDMVITQPVIYEFPLLGAIPHSLLVVGDKDTTAIGKQWSPPAVQAVLGHYDVLGPQAAKAIGSNCTYVHYPDLGHAPQISAPDRFHYDLIRWLNKTN
jgi:pimeloyl-ACP methyl ester carboxylesterase